MKFPKLKLNVYSNYCTFHACIGMVGLTGLFTIYNIAIHGHQHPRKDLPYLKLRNKPFPWECKDCDLFDMDCWDECRGGAKKEDAHH